LGGRGRQIIEFEASLVYRVNSMTARATQRNPVLKKQKQTNKQTKPKPKQQQQKNLNEFWVLSNSGYYK
jgi:phage regulator Rha-like protein